MRKISELSSDEFFDVIYSLSPILPLVTEMEIVQIRLFGNKNDIINEQDKIVKQCTLAVSKCKDVKKIEDYTEKVENAKSAINKEVTGIFARDIVKIIPPLTSKANRSCLFETLSIIDNVPIEEVKKYSPAKTISKIKQIIRDVDFKDFLAYAEQSELTE